MGLIFFALFALSLAGMYIAIRREVAPPGLVAALGMVASIITMMLYLLTQVDVPVQGVIFGVLIGVVFAVATLAIALYFHSHDGPQVNVDE